jgi:hypothetical protein
MDFVVVSNQSRPEHGRAFARDSIGIRAAVIEHCLADARIPLQLPIDEE